MTLSEKAQCEELTVKLIKCQALKISARSKRDCELQHEQSALNAHTPL